MRTHKSELARAEIKISYQATKSPVIITGSNPANEVFQEVWNYQLLHAQMQVYALFLNQANAVMCWRLICSGTGTACPVDVKLIAAIACKTLASGVVIATNHPSGKILPSQADKIVSLKLKQALEMFDITFVDHLIVTENNYFSFVDSGLMYNPQTEI